MVLREGDLDPGSYVFMDQYESYVLGRKWESRGCNHDADLYKDRTLFYDSGSSKIHAHHQVSLDTVLNLQGKYLFEHIAALVGVTLSSYCADNHIFNS